MLVLNPLENAAMLDLKFIRRWTSFPPFVAKVLLLLSSAYPALEAHAASCGSNALTYGVYDTNGMPAAGIRCVKLIESTSASTYSFVWYGEGNWGGGAYRNLGQAYYHGDWPGASAADIYGNGESFAGKADNLQMSIVGNWPAPQEIHVSGDWNEVWRLVQSVGWTPLPRVMTCGPHFVTDIVKDGLGTGVGSGVRCALGWGAWFGSGDWNGTTYSHIGWFGYSAYQPGPGAVDLCDPAFGESCGAAPVGSLHLSGYLSDLVVTGAWNEKWYSPSLATYNPSYKAPYCATAGSAGTAGTACTSGAILKGRGPVGPEANGSNTIDGCADGTGGTYHSDESLEALTVSTVDGTPLAFGKTVRIDAKVWAWSGYTSDHLDLYYAADASSPSWTFIGTLTPTTSGEVTLSATYNLPYGATTQAIRAQFRYSGTAGTCSSGSFDDRDDLVFTVAQGVRP